MAAGVLAGLVGLIGLAAIYRGMAIGVVSVVSTIAATGPIVPILVGLVTVNDPACCSWPASRWPSPASRCWPSIDAQANPGGG